MLFSLAILVILFVLFYTFGRTEEYIPPDMSKTESERIIDKVSKILTLPTDEKPVVATVKDPEKLKNEQFFSGAKVGDKILIYTKYQKAVLYDAIKDKVKAITELKK